MMGIRLNVFFKVICDYIIEKWGLSLFDIAEILSKKKWCKVYKANAIEKDVPSFFFFFLKKCFCILDL